METKRLIRWFMVVALVAVFIGGGLFLGGHPTAVRGEDDNSPGDEAVSSAGDSSGAEEGLTDEKQDDSAADGAGTKDDEAEEEEDAGQSGVEGKTFVCSRCGFTSDEAGDCPACNLPLTEVAAGSVETAGGAVRADAGDDHAEVDAGGDVKAVSGKKAAEVSPDGSVHTDDGTGNSVNIKAGGQVDLKSGDFHLNTGGAPGGY